MVNRNELSANFTFISKGDFKERIILDDYNNYYHHMLSDKQLFINISFIYNELNKTYNRDEMQVSTYLNCSYGFLNLFEFFYKNEYIWNKRVNNTHTSNEASYQDRIGFKFRSYKYDLEKSSKWVTDESIDVIQGSIPKFGEVYAEFTYKPPRYRYYFAGEIGLYSLGKLRSDESAEISFSLMLGLGRNYVFNLYFSEYFRKSELEAKDYSIGLSKRLLNRIDFSIKYEESFGDRYRDIYNEHENIESTVTATFQALF